MELQPTNHNQPLPPAPDETGYYMPVPGRGDSWVYGEPVPGGGQTADLSPVPQADAEAQSPISGLNGGSLPGGVSSSAAQSQRMKNPVDMAHTHMPSGADEAYRASLRSLLDRNVGYYVEATFLINQNLPTTWKGILHTVGTDYVVIYQPDYERYISGDLYALKFVQFYNVKGVPYAAAAQNWQGRAGL